MDRIEDLRAESAHRSDVNQALMLDIQAKEREAQVLASEVKDLIGK